MRLYNVMANGMFLFGVLQGLRGHTDDAAMLFAIAVWFRLLYLEGRYRLVTPT